MESRKLVLFGAGKIGRSFIGQLFSRSGFEVVFIDIDARLISALNENNEYKVIIKSETGDEEIWVKNVRGIHGSKINKIAKEIAECDLMAISVGQKAFPHIVPAIAEGVKLRYSRRPDDPLDIILAENMRNAASAVGQKIDELLLEDIDLDEYLGLIETSIGKMVPIMTKAEVEKDPLLVYAEPYNTLILDRAGFKNGVPEVDGLAPKNNMTAWVDRKSFIHNLGHAAAAYYGNVKYPELIYLYELMAKKNVFEVTRKTMVQSANVLLKAYPDDFNKSDLVAHIDDLIDRFGNKALGDTVFRVGQDLYRKLGPNDRIAGAIRLAVQHQMPFNRILHILACSLAFKATDEQGTRNDSDIKFSLEANQGISHVLESICKLDCKTFPQVHATANNIVF